MIFMYSTGKFLSKKVDVFKLSSDFFGKNFNHCFSTWFSVISGREKLGRYFICSYIVMESICTILSGLWVGSEKCVSKKFPSLFTIFPGFVSIPFVVLNPRNEVIKRSKNNTSLAPDILSLRQ